VTWIKSIAPRIKPEPPGHSKIHERKIQPLDSRDAYLKNQRRIARVEINAARGNETGLPPNNFRANVAGMSAVELAVKKVKKLSARQAKELLGWLDARQPKGTALKRPTRRKASSRRAMQKLKAWQDSVRGTTDWQPPRMPDDLVKPFRF